MSPSDYWQEHREYQRRKRAAMVRCLGCGFQIYPDEVCIKCETPGPNCEESMNADK